MNDKQPFTDIRIGNVRCAIWRDEHKWGPSYSVRFEARYKAKDGNWKGTNAFSGDDLPLLVKVADRAHDTIFALQTEDRQKAKAEAENGQI